jgi:N-carbamoylputrescine amidase
MTFYPWVACSRRFDEQKWEASVEAHRQWLQRMDDLAPAIVLSSRPVSEGTRRLNEGFLWDPQVGYQAVHTKYYLPDDEGFWEASWYQRGDGRFVPVQRGQVRIGFAICTELWFMEHARANKTSLAGNQPAFGGRGWVAGPEGQVLGLTSPERPFVTVDIDLREADLAKQTYPRYVAE